MKTHTILLVCSFLFVLYSCQRESTANNPQQIEKIAIKNTSNQSEESIVKSEVDQKLETNHVEINEKSNIITAKEDPDIIEIKEETPALPSPSITPAREIEKIKVEQINISPNKEKTCGVLLEEYKETIKKFLENEDEKYMVIIGSWTNDVIFNQCKNDSALKAEFDKWEGILNSDE